jgi:hypothetical protein
MLLVPRHRLARVALVGAVFVGLGAATTTFAQADPQAPHGKPNWLGKTVTVCHDPVKPETRFVRKATPCKPGEKRIAWQRAGAKGKAGKDGKPGKDGKDGARRPAGSTGARGPQGEVGPRGPAGSGASGGKSFVTFLATCCLRYFSASSGGFSGEDVASPFPYAGTLTKVRVWSKSAATPLNVEVYKNGEFTGDVLRLEVDELMGELDLDLELDDEDLLHLFVYADGDDQPATKRDRVHISMVYEAA